MSKPLLTPEQYDQAQEAIQILTNELHEDEVEFARKRQNYYANLFALSAGLGMHIAPRGSAADRDRVIAKAREITDMVHTSPFGLAWKAADPT